MYKSTIAFYKKMLLFQTVLELQKIYLYIIYDEVSYPRNAKYC